jgi:hypothetical protein
VAGKVFRTGLIGLVLCLGSGMAGCGQATPVASKPTPPATVAVTTSAPPVSQPPVASPSAATHSTPTPAALTPAPNSLRVTSRTTADWTGRPPNVPLAPTTPVGVHALSGNVLVVTATDGLWRSADAGRSWARTLTFPAGLAGSALGAAGAGVVATATSAGGKKTQLYLSDDGLTWRGVDTVGWTGGSLVLNGTGPHAIGFSWVDSRRDHISNGGISRTVDGGRRWTIDAKIPYIGGITYVPGSSTVFAAAMASATAPACDGHLTRSDDSGLTWHDVAGTCTGQNLFDVGFVDSLHGFALGGTPNHYGGSQLAYATDDGGRTWHRRFATSPIGEGGPQFPDGFAELAFTSVENGFALSGACVGGGDGPCGGGLWRTTDGGRSWQDTGQKGLELSASGTTVLLSGGWSTRSGLDISTDGGRSWTLSVQSSSIFVSQLTAYTGGLFAVTSAGGAVSKDAGRTWQPMPLPNTVGAVWGQAVLGSHGLIVANAQQRVLEWSTDGGTTLQVGKAAPKAEDLGTGNVAADAADDVRATAIVGLSTCGSVAMTTKDAGRSWQRSGALPGLVQGAVGYADHVMAVVAMCDEDWDVDVSHDDGQSWTARTLKAKELTGAGVAAGSIWLTGNDMAGNEQVWLSTDGGATWTERDLLKIGQPMAMNATILPLSATSALLSFGDGSLWRTTDSGASWRQERPTWPAN